MTANKPRSKYAKIGTALANTITPSRSRERATPLFAVRSVADGTHHVVLSRRYTAPDDGVIVLRIASVWRLDARELRIFCAVLSLAGMASEYGDATPIVDHRADLKRVAKAIGLVRQHDRPTMPADRTGDLRIETTARGLLREAGLNSGGREMATLRRALRRLQSVVIDYTIDDKDISGGALIARRIDRKTGRTEIKVSALAGAAIANGMPHIRLAVDDQRRLRSDAAVLIHFLLSTRIRPGRIARFRIDTVARRIHADHTVTQLDRRALAKRRATIDRAMLEIGRLEHWRVSRRGRGSATVYTVTHSAGIRAT